MGKAVEVEVCAQFAVGARQGITAFGNGLFKAETIVFEERAGGRVYEVMSDGTEGTWATILTWDPPRGFVLAWKPNLTDNPPTELEITFTTVLGAGRDIGARARCADS